MEVNNVILIFEKCTGYLLLVLTMLHLGQIVTIYLTITTYHMSKGKKNLLLMPMHATNYSLNHVIKTPCRTSALTSHEWVQEIINGHNVRCFQMFRMRKDVFLQLCNVLQCKYGLRPTRGMGIHEQVGLLLYVLGQLGSISNTEERFQHSGETIS